MIEESVRADLRDHIRVAVAIGDDDFDAVVENGVDYLDGEADQDALTTAARQIATEEFAEYLSAQRTWPRVLDSDRMLRAFRELEMAGIVARADFTCCQSCGTAEIGGEVPEGTAVRGYTFCHRQDIERAVEGGGVYLSYGVFSPDSDPDETAAIAREIVTKLRGHGLTVNWNGQVAKRIQVPLTWRRRRSGQLADWPGASQDGTGDAAPLKATYYDYSRGRGADEPVPMSAEEGAQLLLDLTPRDGNFAVFAGQSDGVVQVMWQAGPRLWLESPDPATRCSRGRHVTLTEAAEMIDILARDDRVELERLGDIETIDWSSK